MKAIESIYAGYVEQTEQKNTPAIEDETRKLEQMLNLLLPEKNIVRCVRKEKL